MNKGIVLMVVDDECIIRQGIIHSYDWSLEGITEIIEATDGMDALTIIKDKRPDIIITDVKMPQMNGLEFAKKVYDNDSSIKVIILSGYDDFSYVQTAIKYNVVDYLLKSCSNEGIISSVRKCVEIIEAERSRENYEHELLLRVDKSLPLLREKFLNRLMLNPYNNENLFEEFSFVKMDISDKDLCVIALEIDNNSINACWNGSNGRQLLHFAIVNVLKEMAEKFNGVAIENPLGYFVIVLSDIKNISIGNSKDRIIRFVQSCIQTIADNLNVKMYAGIGNVADDLYTVCNSYKEAVLALECTYALAVDYLHIEDIFENNNTNKNYLTGFEEKIFCKVITGDDDNIKSDIDNYIIYATKNSFCTLEYLKGFFCGVISYLECRFVELNFNEPLNKYDKRDMFGIIRMCGNVKDLIDNVKTLLCSMASYFKNLQRDKNHMVILTAKQFIDDNLHDCDLSLETIARRVNFSPNYFVNMFKKAEGESPTEYITRKRMEKAKQLLVTPNLQVNQICRMVGYHDQRYFSQIFKKYCGQLPTEYIKSFLG